MPRNLHIIQITDREHGLILEALALLYEDACEDADEGKADEISSLQDEIQNL